jgi:hypothetical protein
MSYYDSLLLSYYEGPGQIKLLKLNEHYGGGLETISVDKDVVDVGDTITFIATDLWINSWYRVGIYDKDTNQVYNPVRFYAYSPVYTGTYTIPQGISYKQYLFVLQRQVVDWETRNYKLITIAPKAIPKVPKISTDKKEYFIGEKIMWTASDLTVCNRYRVGLMRNGTIIRDTLQEFHADAEVKSGSLDIKLVAIGSYNFILIEYIKATDTWKVVSQTPIEIKQSEEEIFPTPTPTPTPTPKPKPKEEEKGVPIILVILGAGIAMAITGGVVYYITKKK